MQTRPLSITLRNSLLPAQKAIIRQRAGSFDHCLLGTSSGRQYLEFLGYEKFCDIMLLIPALLFFEIIRKAVLFDVPNLKDS